MKDLRIKTTTGTETVLGEATIEDFGSRLHGELSGPATKATRTLANSGTA